MDVDALTSAAVGASLALAAAAVFKLLRRSRVDREERDLREELERSRQGLLELTREVEERLDRKLDRLEVLVREAKRMLGCELNAKDEALEGQGVLRSSTTASAPERERVLALLASGKRPEAIAQAVGLQRGEVDLILRLHQSAERLNQTSTSG